MKTLTTQLQSLFATGQMCFAGLYNFNLIGGSSLYYSSGDVDISLVTADSGGDPFWENQYFTAGGTVGPYFDRKDNKAKMHCAVGLQVDTLTFDVIPGSSTIEGAPFLTAVREGVFDGAELIYLGAYWPGGTYANPVIPTGTVKKFIGNVAEVDISRNLATFTINSYLELLNQNLPINLYQATCVNTLYDPSCTLNKANFSFSGTVASGSTNSAINSNLSQATGYFNLGTITFTSGANEGVSRTVGVSSSGGIVNVIAPLPNAPAAGDSFTIARGCNKLLNTCAVDFNNLANFRGFCYMPQQETAS
jgi:uncharacterized phage protein (TIGR02218 family)